MSNDDGGKDNQDLIDVLKGYGWDDEKAQAFLDDKVKILRLQIPGKCLLGVIQAVSREGIATGTISVDFIVPDGNRAAFQEAAETAVAKQGGFVFSPEEHAMLSGIKPETMN